MTLASLKLSLLPIRLVQTGKVPLAVWTGIMRTPPAQAPLITS